MEAAQEKSSKNAWLYAVFMWFFGGLGIHKFYLNRTGMGIAYLLTGAFAGIGLFVDITLLAFKKVKDSEGKELDGAKGVKILSIIFLVLMVIGTISTIASFM